MGARASRPQVHKAGETPALPVLYCVRCLVLFILTVLGTLPVSAESIGLRFMVDSELGRSATQRQTTGATLARYVAELNGYFSDSLVNLRAEIVDIEFSRFASDDVMQLLTDMEHEQHGFERLFSKANELGADFTVGISGKLMMRGKRGCGRAYAVNKTVAEISSTRRAFAVIDFACGAHTLAHELGHLMGLNHGSLVAQCQPKMGHTTAIAPYANGYAIGPCNGQWSPAKFGTIMVGGWMREINGNQKSVPLFSNPRLRDARCGENMICGDPLLADEARALNENAHHYAAHEEADVHTLRYESAALKACITQRYKGKEIAELEELICPNAGIETVGGIEQLTALRRIDLSGNSLRDLQGLLNLAPDRMVRMVLEADPSVSCQTLEKLALRFPGKIERVAHCGGSRQ